MDKQQLNGRSIVQVDPPYDGHYCMGMRNYLQICAFEEVIKFSQDNELPLNFWWVYAEDFPFPKGRANG
jgi:hypothetical protein